MSWFIEISQSCRVWYTDDVSVVSVADVAPEVRMLYGVSATEMGLDLIGELPRMATHWYWQAESFVLSKWTDGRDG